MELETLEFSVIDASLDLAENTILDEPRDLEFLLQLTSEAEVMDHEGQLFRSIPWFLSVTAKHEGDAMIHPEDNIGTLKYTSHRHHWCSARICIGPLKFQNLIESLMHGKRVSRVTIGVRGLRNSEHGLVWPQADGVELPIEEVGFSIKLLSPEVS